VNDIRWVNTHQPQTLVNATILCYLQAALGLIFTVVAESQFVIIFILVGLVAGGFGVANEKKWGYTLAVAASVVQLAALLGVYRMDAFTTLNGLLTFGFDAALVALLLHPMSRDYQRIWFK
jgi:hypothetical protein